MKRTTRFAAVCLLLLACTLAGQAQEVKGLRGELLGQTEYVQKQILDLENAIPANKMTWRPNADVRTISEVYSHIAFSNYAFGKVAGATMPAGITIAGFEDEGKWEKMTSDKSDIHEQLVKSFDFFKNFVKNMSDANLETTVNFFGQQMTVRSLLIIHQSHMHEHFGQSIAYARMIGIVPPWTAAQMAAEKAKK